MPDNQIDIDKKKLKEYFKERGITQEMISKKLGISQPLVNAYLNNKTFGKKTAEKWAKTFGISPNWLLVGVGEMINKKDIDNIVDRVLDDYNIKPKIRKTFPLIPIDAIAGYGEDGNGVSLEDCEQYLVPDFEAKGMEFLIRVSGSSMEPKYSNGDVLACMKIRELLFFQWGKVYVIDSSQGQLVKRIYEDKDNPDNIVCASDNKDQYPPFSIPKSDIRSISIVLGAVKME